MQRSDQWSNIFVYQREYGIRVCNNPLAPWRSETYTEYISPAFGSRQMIFRTVRTSSYFYAEYDNGDQEFYDLSIDPLEEFNRVNDPGYSKTVRDLQQVLQVLKKEP